MQSACKKRGKVKRFWLLKYVNICVYTYSLVCSASKLEEKFCWKTNLCKNESGRQTKPADSSSVNKELILSFPKQGRVIVFANFAADYLAFDLIFNPHKFSAKFFCFFVTLETQNGIKKSWYPIVQVSASNLLLVSVTFPTSKNTSVQS